MVQIRIAPSIQGPSYDRQEHILLSGKAATMTCILVLAPLIGVLIPLAGCLRVVDQALIGAASEGDTCPTSRGLPLLRVA